MEEHMGFGDFIFRNPNDTRKSCASAVWRSCKIISSLFPTIRCSLPYQSQPHEPLAFAPCHLPSLGILEACHLAEACRMSMPPSDYLSMPSCNIVAHHENFGVRGQSLIEMKSTSLPTLPVSVKAPWVQRVRGLAFLDKMIKRHPEFNRYEKCHCQIPKDSRALYWYFRCSYDRATNLYPIALSDASDEEIWSISLRCPVTGFPDCWLFHFLWAQRRVLSPSAPVRFLEDAHYQPFAGIYSTYMILISGG